MCEKGRRVEEAFKSAANLGFREPDVTFNSKLLLNHRFHKTEHYYTRYSFDEPIMALNGSSTTGVPTFELAASLISFSVLTAVATPANGFLIAAFVYNRRLRSVTNVLVIGLACADLLVGILAIPCWMSVFIKQFYHAAMGVVSYQFYITLDIFIGCAAILQLTSISLERCHAVTRPIKHRLLSKKMFYGALVAAWVAAAFIASLHPMQSHKWEKVYTALLTAVCFVLPSAVISVAYVQVFVTTRRPNQVQRNAQKAHLARETRLSLTVVMITLLFVATWLPLFALTLVATYIPKYYPQSSLLLMFAKWMHYSSSVINPFLYAFRNNDIKVTIRVMLCRFFFRKGPSLRELSYVSSLRTTSFSVISRGSCSSSVRRPSNSSSSGRKRSTSSDGNNNAG